MVCHPAQRHGDGVTTTQRRHRGSPLNNANLAGQRRMRGLPRPPDGIGSFMRFTWRCCSPISRGRSPQPRWPLCLFAAALIHQRSLPTGQQVRDLVTCLFVGEGFSRRRGNWFIPPPITHPFKVFDWPGLPSRRRGDRARDYGDEEGPRRERQEFCNFTAERKSC